METVTETREQSRDRARAETKARYTALYEGVASHLPGWRTQIQPSECWEGQWSYKLVSNVIGQALTLVIQRDKVGVSGYWPQDVDGRYMSPRDVNAESPSISVSLSRGPKAIANEMQRRFLKPYLTVWGLLIERVEQRKAYVNKKQANWQKIAGSGWVTSPHGEAGVNGDPTASIRFGGRDDYDYSRGYGDVRMTGDDSVEIKLSSLPVTTALAVLKVLSEVGK